MLNYYVEHLKQYFYVNYISGKEKDEVWYLGFRGKLQLSYHIHTCLGVSSWPLLSFSFLIWRVEIIAVPWKPFHVSPVPTVQSLHAFTYSKLSASWSHHAFPGLSDNWCQAFGSPFPKHMMYFHDSVPIVFFAWIFFLRKFYAFNKAPLKWHLLANSPMMPDLELTALL